MQTSAPTPVSYLSYLTRYGAGKPAWGLYQDGEPCVQPDVPSEGSGKLNSHALASPHKNREFTGDVRVHSR